MKDRNKAIPAAYLFLEKDGKFLISRRCNTGYQDGNYQVPAGHVDEGELPSEALIREAKEEIGIDLFPNDFELVHVSYRPKHDNTDNRVDFFFRAKNWSGEVKNMEPNKCDDLKWVTVDELPKTMTAHVRDALECMQKGIFFKELGIPFLKEHGLYML
ncbi:MAG: NUDIX domain-containing protein [bacterium]|nr:NUDIX domain-containing protein [bacterium]